MFSDTHFHFPMMNELSSNGKNVLSVMEQRDCYFGLDIGTKADDLLKRQTCINGFISDFDDEKANKIRGIINYSAGIWPDVDSIKNRFEEMDILKKSIQNSSKKIVAIGEGGIDHHWNPSGVDGRCENDFDKAIYDGEKELFEMQLDLAKQMNLPMIVHSRDGFEDTLECIKNVGYHKGIIHCYSYGFEEAKSFLDLGWYISFSGSVTYTKKSKMEDMQSLLKYIPEDRILCETDSPYLAPVPHRGEKNSPIYVEHVYDFVAQARNISSEDLSRIVDKNIDVLFFNK